MIASKLNMVRIILVGTTHPGNIGAAARAMKTMGLSRLVLVSPRFFPDLRAQEMAAGATDILEQAEVFDNLSEALSSAHLILATSARPRDIALPGLIPAEAGRFIAEHSDFAEIAIVFGRESSGLTNDELLHCHYHIQIPANDVYSSLNLAQAVQVIAYEIRMQLFNPEIKKSFRNNLLARADEVEGFYTHLGAVLRKIGFLKLSNPKRLEQRLRRLFGRIGLEKNEINILRGILTHVERFVLYKGNSDRAKK